MTNRERESSPEDPDSVPQIEADDPLLTHVTRRAMATEFAVILPQASGDQVESAVATLEQLDAIENALTIYRPDSEISRVNQLAHEQPVALSHDSFRLIEKALQWSRRTDGAFDITAGPLVEVWGFTRRSGRKPNAAEIERALQKVGYQHIDIDASRQTIGFARGGMAINLGAIGKGDALDRIAASLRDQGIGDFLIHGGQSSVIALGDQKPGSGQGWAVGIAHPTKPRRRLAGLWLRDQALATSGSGKQFFHHRGRRYGHVIDPRTGYPAGDLMSLTVIMDSAADADACATGLFVLGSQAIESLASEAWFPPLVTARQSDRQDDMIVQGHGEIQWAQPPADA